MPTVRLTLVSDGIEFDRKDGSLSIFHAFERKRIMEFPVEGEFIVTVFWHSSINENVDESFTVVDSAGDVIAAKPPTRVIFDKSLQITFTRFKDVLFQFPDIYTVNVYANENIADTASFVIEQDTNE